MPENDLDDDAVDRAIGQLADGQPVDWAALEQEVRSDGVREVLKYLRIVGDITNLHASIPDPIAESDRAAAGGGQASTAVTEGVVEMWGRYRLIEKVGEGTFGTVHRAWDPELEWEVAIKILHRHFTEAHLKERLLREGRALAKVQHPNVVRVLGVESHGDRVGLCMEFVRGETLEEVLQTHGVLNAREAVLVGEDVCGALAAVHLAGFVHRDVKARNVMRERTGRIVLMDFGTGLEMRPATTRGPLDIAGTPAYMAPEVLTGGPASARSDVYSVGVLLYRLVTSEYPVDGRTMEDLHEAHVQGRRRLLSERRPDLPLPFILVVERAIAADPLLRHPSAGALLEALGTVDADAQAARGATGRFLATALLVVACVACALTTLGYLTCSVFNLAVDRSRFADEGLRDWFVWGLTASVGPTVLLLLASAVGAMVTVLCRLLLSMSAYFRRMGDAGRRRLSRAARHVGLDDLPTLASWLLLASALMLVSGWWYFSPLLAAVLTHASTAPAEDLAFLSPGYQELQDHFRQVFTLISIFSIFAWVLIVRRAVRKKEPLSQGLLAGGIIVVVLSVLTLDMPYRLLIQAKADVVRWDAADCYVLGERADDALIFCPTIQPPRNRVVQKFALQPLGTRENIFTTFSPTASK
jgi:hypothetical protein